MKSLALFNNKGGVGKTTLTFNIAHMLSRLGLRTVVLDYDPQCNISAIFLSEQALFDLWELENLAGATVYRCIDAVRRGKGDVVPPKLVPTGDNLWLLPGDLGLSRFEQTLAEEWPKTKSVDNERALAVTTALDLLSNMAADAVGADLVLLDVGPSLGALNRAALLACDNVVLPLAPDLFSLQGLKNVGPTLIEWRRDWAVVRRDHLSGREQQALPAHGFEPVGYIVQQHLARADRPVAGYERWLAQIPAVFHGEVLGEQPAVQSLRVDSDSACIAMLKHFASLVPLAQIARKPMFDLKRADGVGGGQIQAVANCRNEFEALVRTLADRLGLPIPVPRSAQRGLF
jgi:cellulose biosynthesis protein BcsQ